MKSILDGVTIGIIGKADEKVHKQVEETAVQVRAAHTCVNMHVTDWVAAHQEDPILKIVME